MATIFRARRNSNSGSGGKILRGRRVASVASPYARPPSPLPPPESPNWLLGLVVPATRKIVNGAGKLVSTVFGNDSISESETDSASSSDDDGSDDDEETSEGSDSLKQDGTTSDANKYLEIEPLAIAQRSEAKLQIEQLLRQETFSRYECDRLTKIIQSRVVESHTSKEGGNVEQNELPDRPIATSSATPGARQSDIQTRKSFSYLDSDFLSSSPRPLSNHHTAIMEAKKWLEDRKSESSLKLDYGHRNFTSSPFMLPNVTDGEVGSPVVLARTYMQARPPWASPSSSYVGLKSPSPVTMNLVKEEAPYSIGADSLSSSKLMKRSSLADESWNILAEARRVRFKSEEDSLKPNSSTHIESSASELEHKDNHSSSRDEREDGELAVIHASDSLPATRSRDSSVDLPAKITANGGFNINSGLGNRTPFPVPATTISNQNQALEDPRLTDGEGCTTMVTNETLVLDFVSSREDGTPDQSDEMVKSEANVIPRDDINPALQSEVDPRLGETAQVNTSSQLNHFSGLVEKEFVDDSRPAGNHSSQNEISGSRERVAANGHPSSASSLSAGSSESKLRKSIPVEEETCEVLSEASVEIPINHEETNSFASESQTSSSRYTKDLSQAQNEPSSRKTSTSRRAEKQQSPKKMGRFSRRIEGRGK